MTRALATRLASLIKHISLFVLMPMIAGAVGWAVTADAAAGDYRGAAACVLLVLLLLMIYAVVYRAAERP